MNIEIIEKELNKLTNKAKNCDEVPISALIVHNDKIIAKAYNKVNKTNNILNHAEIMVIKKAQKKLNNWRLNNCDLYVTLEPCSMCKEIIKKSRIENVYYFIKQNKYKTESDPNYEHLTKNDSFSKKLSSFFKEKR